MKNRINVTLIIMFLCGVMIFLLPIWNQIQEMEKDEQEYTAILEQYRPATATSPPQS